MIFIFCIEKVVDRFKGWKLDLLCNGEKDFVYQKKVCKDDFKNFKLILKIYSFSINFGANRKGK